MWLYASCDACFDMNLGKISAKSRQNFSRQDEAMQQLPEAGFKISISGSDMHLI
jgi:hypothetical protein